MMPIAFLTILAAGTAGLAIACGRAISAARFGRSLEAARVSPPTRLPRDNRLRG